MEGWKSGEYKALTEVFREEEYTFCHLAQKENRL